MGVLNLRPRNTIRKRFTPNQTWRKRPGIMLVGSVLPLARGKACILYQVDRLHFGKVCSRVVRAWRGNDGRARGDPVFKRSRVEHQNVSKS